MLTAGGGKGLTAPNGWPIGEIPLPKTRGTGCNRCESLYETLTQSVIPLFLIGTNRESRAVDEKIRRAMQTLIPNQHRPPGVGVRHEVLFSKKLVLRG